mgnify:CR=1 FL=1
MEKRQENLEDKIVKRLAENHYPLLPQNPVPEDL